MGPSPDGGGYTMVLYAASIPRKERIMKEQAHQHNFLQEEVKRAHSNIANAQCLGTRKIVLIIAMTAFCFLVAHCESWCQDENNEDPWIPLFNGKNLDGWKVKIAGHELNDNYGDTFRVEDGILKVSYDQYDNFEDKFGHLFYKETFSHYVLRVEYRFVGNQAPGGPGWALRNSGIMIHGQSAESMEKDQSFPVSIEVQTLGGNGEDARATGNLCTPGTNVVMNDELITRHCTDSKSKTYHGDLWVMLEIEVHGNSLIKHIVNGQTVLQYEKPQLDAKDEYARKLIKNGQKNAKRGHDLPSGRKPSR